MKARHDMITVFIVRPDGPGTSHELLQLLRAPAEYMGGTWQTIRGGVEAGETAVAAALRELREESGLTPAELYRLSSLESFYTEADDTVWHAPVFCALVARDAAVKMDHEHTDYRWVPIDAADRSFMWPGERALIDEMRHEILFGGLAKPHLLIKL